MPHPIAPDTTRRPGQPAPTPTHYHGYQWSGSGQEWERLGKVDSLDLNSPDRPPDRTVEWLGKSPGLLQSVHTDPAAACDWLIGQWEKACERPMYPVPDWVRDDDRAERALEGIVTGCWPSYSQWVAGGMKVCMAIVGTADRCH